MSKFERSWVLFKRSVGVVFDNKRLLLFPVVVTLFMLVIAALLLAPVALWPSGHAYGETAHWQAVGQRWASWDADGKNVTLEPAGVALAAVIYLAATFLATFFNVAFYSQILEALRGRPVTIGAGLRLAMTRIKAIAAWSLFTGLVGLLIRSLEERVGLLGRWIVKLIGIAWSVASVFVVPVIVVGQEGTSPVRLLKTSAGTLRKTWGESLLGYMGVQFGGLLMLVASVVWLGLAAWLGFATENLWILWAAGGVWLVCVLTFAYLLSMASHVYRGALFLYATEGAAPRPFDADQMNMAWKHKRGKGPGAGDNPAPDAR